MRAASGLRALFAGAFIRAVGILVGGTVLAQIVLGLTLPIATRLYSPDDFNLLAVFTSVVATLSVAACLRYDVAIPLPEHDEDAGALLLISLILAGAISLGLLAVVLVGTDEIARLLGQPRLAPFLWLLPLAVFLAGAYSAAQFWLVRSKAFPTLARSRIAQALCSSSTQISLGFAAVAPLGLLLGQLANSGVAAVWLLWTIVRAGGVRMREVWPRLRPSAQAYRRFPTFSAPEALCNSAAIYVPIVALGALAEGPEAGFLMLGMYALQLPMSLVGGAVSQVYMSRGPEERRAGTLGAFTRSVLAGLSKTGIGPLLCLGIAAPPLFSVVFGPEWERAGVLVAWMTPWFIFQFMASPVSLALHITDRLGTALLLQVLGLLMRTGSIAIAYGLSTQALSEAYALSGLLFYLTYLVVVVRITGAGLAQTGAAVLRAWPIWLAWAGLGWLLGLLLRYGSSM